MELESLPNTRPRFIFPKLIDWDLVPEIIWNSDQLITFAQESNYGNKTLLGKVSPEKAEELCLWRETLYIVKWNNLIWLCNKEGWIVYILNKYWNQRRKLLIL